MKARAWSLAATLLLGGCSLQYTDEKARESSSGSGSSSALSSTTSTAGTTGLGSQSSATAGSGSTGTTAVGTVSAGSTQGGSVASTGSGTGATVSGPSSGAGTVGSASGGPTGGTSGSVGSLPQRLYQSIAVPDGGSIPTFGALSATSVSGVALVGFDGTTSTVALGSVVGGAFSSVTTQCKLIPPYAVSTGTQNDHVTVAGSALLPGDPAPYIGACRLALDGGAWNPGPDGGPPSPDYDLQTATARVRDIDSTSSADVILGQFPAGGATVIETYVVNTVGRHDVTLPQSMEPQHLVVDLSGRVYFSAASADAGSVVMRFDLGSFTASNALTFAPPLRALALAANPQYDWVEVGGDAQNGSTVPLLFERYQVMTGGGLTVQGSGQGSMGTMLALATYDQAFAYLYVAPDGGSRAYRSQGASDVALEEPLGQVGLGSPSGRQIALLPSGEVVFLTKFSVWDWPYP